MRIAIVGRGLIGAAAARHLAVDGHQVVVIGPGEPQDKRRHRGVFASHYDEGRITRALATEPFWSEVSVAAMARYGEISEAGGNSFFTPCGAMMAGPRDHAFTQGTAKVRAAHAIDATELDAGGLAARFPCFSFPDGFIGFHEPGGGHISPRRLIAAQSHAAARAGARMLAEVALDISEDSTGASVRTTSGSHHADRVLIATGAMTDHLAPVRLRQRVYARTVALFELDQPEVARLANMPSLVFRTGDGAEPYLLPPIRYPDGRHYLKLGGDPVDVELHTAREIGDWFRSGGSASVRDHLTTQIRGLMPDLAIRAVRMDACVTTFTPSGRPVIDWLGGQVAVASGGNGAAAKCSDELGRLAAVLTSGGTDPMLAQTRLTE